MATSTFKVKYLGDETTGNWGTRDIGGSYISAINEIIRQTIPRYSKITSASIAITIKTSLSSKGDVIFCFYDDLDSYDTIRSFNESVGKSYVTITDSTNIVGKLQSDGYSAGEIISSRKGIGVKRQATVYRQWYWKDAYLTIQATNPTYTIALSPNESSYGTVSGAGTWNITVASFNKTITATPAVGCKFVKWSDGDTNATRTITISNGQPTTTLSLIAYFEPVSGTLNIDYQGGNFENKTFSVEYDPSGYASIALQNPTKNGYKFSGWTYTNNSGGSFKILTTATEYYYGTIDGAIDTLTAIWEPNPIYIGDKPIKEIYIGTNKVKEVYIGTTKIYG